MVRAPAMSVVGIQGAPRIVKLGKDISGAINDVRYAYPAVTLSKPPCEVHLLTIISLEPLGKNEYYFGLSKRRDGKSWG